MKRTEIHLKETKEAENILDRLSNNFYMPNYQGKGLNGKLDLIHNEINNLFYEVKNLIGETETARRGGFILNSQAYKHTLANLNRAKALESVFNSMEDALTKYHEDLDILEKEELLPTQCPYLKKAR